MTLVFRRFAICMLAFLMATPLCYAEDVSQAFAAALAANLSPVEEALATGRYSLRTGEAAVFPSCSGGIIPYDEQTGALLPTQPGEFSSSDPGVVTVDSTGKMTAIGEGTAVVAYLLGEKKTEFIVDVSAQNMPELAKAMVYVANEEYFRVHRARLPKYNQYAKWYYGKRKEVGWCSVFVIWCANQAGANPVKLTKLPDTLSDRDTLFLREGQVGHQYDGYFKTGRFSGVPKPGYLVIYGDLRKAYRTTHIGIVVDVEEKADGCYEITTVEGNMSNSVKRYRYLYDGRIDNSTVGVEKNRKLTRNITQLDSDQQTDPLIEYEVAPYFTVFGFCESWK